MLGIETEAQALVPFHFADSVLIIAFNRPFCNRVCIPCSHGWRSPPFRGASGGIARWRYWGRRQYKPQIFRHLDKKSGSVLSFQVFVPDPIIAKFVMWKRHR